MKRFSLFVALAGVSFGATINATTCSVANVNSAITTAASGDTVSVPSGTCAWDTGGGVSIPSTKGINLVGGRGGTTTITGNAGLVIASNASVQTTVSNFTFTGIGTTNNGDVSVGGSATSAPYRIHHNIFTNSGQVVFIVVSGNGTGLIDHNTMTFGGGSESIHNVALGPSDTSGWSNDVTPGSSNMVFVEDNTFNNTDTTFIASGIQSYYGARTVVRHNTFIFTQIDQHGTSGNIGARWWELYQNTFESMGLNQCCYMAIRAGSGVIWGNVTSGPEPAFGDATIELVEEDSGYPALYQIGRGISQALSPAYVWGNGATLDVVSGSGNVQINRDYYLSGSQPSSLLRQELSTDNSMTTYSYVPYPYPNPLQGITVCASGCTYTTINAADLAAACGATITILAGQGDGTGSNGTPNGWYCGGGGTCNGNNPVLLTHACTVGNELTMTTDQVAKLPATGVRITPAYGDGAAPVVPTIYNPGSGLVLYAKTGNGGSPASGYILKGLQFCCNSGGTNDFFNLGSQGQGTLDSTLNVTADIPNNFQAKQILIRADPTKEGNRCLDLDALNMRLTDSWIDCPNINSSSTDINGISSFMGNGSIMNTLISGPTETIGINGGLAPVLAPTGLKSQNIALDGPSTVLIASSLSGLQIPAWEIGFSEVTKDDLLYTLTWNSTLGLVPKGKVIRSSTSFSTVMVALNTGTACTTQPTWPGSVGGTVTDCNGIVWKRTDNAPSIKNGIECKTVDSLNIHHNFIHQIWNTGQQGYAFTITSSPASGTQQHCNNTNISNNFLKQVGTIGPNISGMDVLNDVNAIPGMIIPAGSYNITTGTNDILDFTLNGTHVAITLAAGTGRTFGATMMSGQMLVDGTNNKLIIDQQFGSYSFQSGDIGGKVLVYGGGGWTKGTYTITGISGTGAILNSSPAAAGTGGGVVLATPSNSMLIDIGQAFATAGVGFVCGDGLQEAVVRARVSGDTGSSCAGINPPSSTTYLPPAATMVLNSVTHNANTTFGISSLAGVTQYGCQNPRTSIWYGCGQVSGILLNNNLATDVNTPKYSTQVDYTYTGGQHMNGVQYLHNTANVNYGAQGSGVNLDIGIYIDGAIGNFFPPYLFQARDNIFSAQSGSQPTQGFCRNGQLYDFSCINWFMGQPSFVDSATASPTSAQAPAGTFSHNVIPGAHLNTATTMNTNPMPSMNLGYNFYPIDNYTTSTAGLALDPVTLKVTASPGPATDYKTPGVDTTLIPRILGAKITTSDRAAILNYTITEPMANSGYGCVAYVTTKDSYFFNAQKVYDNTNYAPVLADMDPSQYTRPDWDGNDSYPQNGYNRTIVIGLNSPLSASSTNYLRLLCPGAAWPEDGTSATVTTVGTLSGSVTLAIQRSPSAAFGTVASISVVYGTTYSRASGTISGGGTQSGTCSGSPLNCAATITGITKGQPLYVQVKYLSAGAAVLYSDSVVASIPQ